MGVKKEIYIVHGCRFGSDFTDDLHLRENFEYLDDNFTANPNQWLLIDGISGEYTFFGIIRKFDEDVDIVEFDCVSDEDTKLIKDKFKELFSDVEIPEIRMYYINHYC